MSCARNTTGNSRGKTLAIRINGRIGGLQKSLDGQFSPSQNERDRYVRIRIFREHQERPGDAFDELCTLSHELGHWRSWALDQPPAGYDRLVSVEMRDKWLDLPEPERLVVFDEEVRAWRHGHVLAAEVGFTDFSAYEATARMKLMIYCKEKLALAEEMVAAFRICAP